MRVVLDTNVVVSAILFEQGRLSWLRAAWAQARITPLIDHACTTELVRALSYPKFRLAKDDIGVLLGEYLPYAVVITASSKRSSLPRCRDPHDQKFLVLAETGKADALVTGDRALLDITGKTRFLILTPSELEGKLRQ